MCVIVAVAPPVVQCGTRGQVATLVEANDEATDGISEFARGELLSDGTICE